MIEALWTIFWGLAGWATVEVVRIGVSTAHTRRPLCTLYPFAKSRKIWIVLSELPIHKEDEFFNKASPIDGVYSFDDLSDYLRHIGRSRLHYDTRFSSDLIPAMYGDDLILIGGYENNNISRIMNEVHREKRSFYMENNVIFERGRRQRSWEISLDDRSRISLDHCLVTKMHNPFSPGQGAQSWVVAFEGVRQFGTLGAVRYWNKQIIKQLGSISAKDNIEAVIAIKVAYVADDFQVENMGIEALYINGNEKK